jgi:hypothetical protein
MYFYFKSYWNRIVVYQDELADFRDDIDICNLLLLKTVRSDKYQRYDYWSMVLKLF